MNGAATPGSGRSHVAARWGLAALVVVVPPGLSLVPLVALWVLVGVKEGWSGAGVAAALSAAAVLGNVVLYAGL